MRRLTLKYLDTLRLSSTKSPSAMRPRNLMRPADQSADASIRSWTWPMRKAFPRCLTILGAVRATATLVYDRLDFDVAVVSAEYQDLIRAGTFPRDRLPRVSRPLTGAPSQP